MNATDLLKKDHDTVKKMFAAFEKMGDKARQKRSSQAEEIREELGLHTRPRYSARDSQSQ